ncbi:MAG: methyltransferase domain-containing protein, partial [Acidobacteriota bacterium]|nr:methyltransferase domain-containing protein [Acidobacteriota bacterium]
AENSAKYLLPRLTPGASLLDIGCGPGTITADFARLLVDGAVVGVDRSGDVIDAARAQAQGVANLRFEVGDVYHLGFEDGSFDVVHAHQVLQHLADPVRALREMRRVLVPGGIVAVRDADFGSFAWAPPDPALDRWMALYHRITQRNGAQADAGRWLKAWVRAAGFGSLEVTSSTWTYESDAERHWWGGLWADRVLESDLGTQALADGLATRAELEEIAEAFRRWADDPDGVFIVPSGEVIAHR